MTYKLYTRPGTGGFAVECALVTAGAAHEVIVTDKDAQASDAFGRLNPMRQVPTMVLPDGTVMTESAAMLIHLAAAHPGKGLAPAPGTPAHATFLRWMLFMAVNLYEADLRYFYADRYTADASGVPAVKTAAIAHMARSFAVIDPALGPWVCGTSRSIADAYLAMLAAWSPEPVAASKVVAVRDDIARDPVYAPIWKRYALDS